MPLFFFHYHTPENAELDDLGCHFDTIELAYADAYRSAIDLGAEMLKAYRNPASHRIDIADADGVILIELHFDEIFRRAADPPRRLRQAYTLQRDLLHERLAVTKALREDMAGVCLAARENVAEAQRVLRRARAG